MQNLSDCYLDPNTVRTTTLTVTRVFLCLNPYEILATLSVLVDKGI